MDIITFIFVTVCLFVFSIGIYSIIVYIRNSSRLTKDPRGRIRDYTSLEIIGDICYIQEGLSILIDDKYLFDNECGSGDTGFLINSHNLYWNCYAEYFDGFYLDGKKVALYEVVLFLTENGIIDEYRSKK